MKSTTCEETLSVIKICIPYTFGHSRDPGEYLEQDPILWKLSRTTDLVFEKILEFWYLNYLSKKANQNPIA
jgi:hypothetical protein